MATTKNALPEWPQASEAMRTCMQGALSSCGRLHTYPFGHPISIERHHITDTIIHQEYWAAAKTDGVRICIFLGTLEEGTPFGCGYTRDGVFVALPIMGPEDMFEGGTILDAEYVAAKKALVLFDVAMIEGRSLVKTPLSKRLQLLGELAEDMEVEDVDVYAKPMVKLSKTLKEGQLKCFGLPSDGVILTPELAQAPLPGTAWNVFKIKNCHTLDVWCVHGKLMYGEADAMSDVMMLRPRVHVFGMEKPLSSGVLSKPCVVEVGVESVTDGELVLMYMGVRPDKLVPNGVYCVNRTLVSVADNVKLTDVVGALTL